VPEKNGKVDLHALMDALGEKQYNEVFVEAGPGLAGALLNEGLVDELICYQAPKLLGDKGQSMVSLPTFTSLEQSISLTLIENCQVGNDIKFIFKPDGNRNVAASD
jgi:diaminohydroxyphosphoribosylaminopyrimidine deaminase/5-amino-6-(5-phosphoribosylamino)uracil reductase